MAAFNLGRKAIRHLQEFCKFSGWNFFNHAISIAKAKLHCNSKGYSTKVLAVAKIHKMENDEMLEARRIFFQKIVDSYETQDEIASILDVTKGYVSQLVNGTTPIGEKAARKIERKLGLEKYSMDRGLDKEISEQRPLVGSVIAHHHEDPLPEGFISIPKSKVSFSAGNGYKISYELIEDGKPSVYRLDWFIEKKINPKNVRRFEVVGDSMEPYLFHGNTVLINLTDNNLAAIRDGDVYAIRYGEELRIKRLYKKLDGSLILRSYNKDYEDEIVSPNLVSEHITIIGRLIDRSGV